MPDRFVASGWRQAQLVGPWRGVLERFRAAGIHIGFTLLIFAPQWLELATIVVHSATNMLAVCDAKRSIALTEMASRGTAVTVLTSGIAALG